MIDDISEKKLNTVVCILYVCIILLKIVFFSLADFIRALKFLRI